MDPPPLGPAARKTQRTENSWSLRACTSTPRSPTAFYGGTQRLLRGCSEVMLDRAHGQTKKLTFFYPPTNPKSRSQSKARLHCTGTSTSKYLYDYQYRSGTSTSTCIVCLPSVRAGAAFPKNTTGNRKQVQRPFALLSLLSSRVSTRTDSV